jgi:hypothetical protein
MFQSLYTIKAVLVLDSDGKRICAKYFTPEFPTAKEQLPFEKNLFAKTYRANGEHIIHCNENP